MLKDSDIVYRPQKKRFPWWVESVAEPTLEVDPERVEAPDIRKTAALWGRYTHREDYEEFIRAFPDVGLKRHAGTDKMIAMWRRKWRIAADGIRNNTPGHSHRDQALRYAADSLYYELNTDMEEITRHSAFVNVAERTGADPWRGSPLEASAMIEKAGLALGASQVGFTRLQPGLQYAGRQDDLPPEMKYVIVVLTEWSPEGAKRSDSMINYFANRVQTFREQNAVWGLRNFIKGLGYRQAVLRAPWPAYGVLAGLGEIGRMNRLVSPIYGAAVNAYPIVTDLPLASDRPIDFGLQRFCRGCRKCARECPVGALSQSAEPTWRVKGEWNTPGKKAYYENGPLCGSYLFANDTSCSICLGVCPWTKQDVTVLHAVSKALSAKLPWAARLFVWLDDLFGYGAVKDPHKVAGWWKLDLPPYGINTMRRH